MIAALTGGSGVVGGAVIRHLIEGGYEVRALARNSSSGAVVAALGAEPVPGDILDPGSLDGLVAGAELVFHVAGVNEMCSANPSAMWKANVEGTRMVMDASRRAGVRRLVHTSSAVTIGEQTGQRGSESTRRRDSYLSRYEETKTVAERLLFEEARGVDVVAVNPSSVQGPGRASGTGELLLRAARGKVPFAFDATFSIVDIDDCAAGHLLAAEKGKSRERYILSGATLSTVDVLGVLSRITGNELNPVYLKRWQLDVLGSAASVFSGLLQRRPTLCREAVRVVAHGHDYDGARATRELGLVYTPVEDTFTRTIEWFKEEGLVD